MSIFGDIAGYINSGRAAKSVSDADIAAEHGVLGEKEKAQSGITNALGNANTNVNAAGDKAIAGVNSSVEGANSNLALSLKNQTNNLQPYLDAGKQGVQSLSDYAASKPTFSFDQSKLDNDPGYQFQKQQGMEAITNSASAQGLGASGNALKELTKFGTGLAGTYYNDAFNRAKSTFDTNQNTTLANLKALTEQGQFGTSELNRASQVTGMQQSQNTMTGGLANANTNTSLAQFLANLNLGGEQAKGNFGMTGAKMAGDYAVGAGQAHATGIMNQSAALASGIGDLASLGFGGGTFGPASSLIFGGKA